jgi:hypothetical protein
MGSAHHGLQGRPFAAGWKHSNKGFCPVATAGTVGAYREALNLSIITTAKRTRSPELHERLLVPSFAPPMGRKSS